ncbi:SE1561 family protein [Halalkalibacillus halophilus]|uniref:SE1561 family protein n=1 Tax=Halalkalibacillus halophilus TaxID=392827 RepID=UPI0004118CC6|nr:SE1561 family protein [Halalkalibacillus halophilus]
MAHQDQNLEAVRARLAHLLEQFENVDPEKLTVEDIDRYIALLNEMEEKLK